MIQILIPPEITHPTQKTLKVRECGLPLSVDDSALIELLDELEVKPTSKILYEKIRHPETNRMTRVLNGTRFFDTDPLEDGKYLPRNKTCAGLRVRIYHLSLWTTPNLTKTFCVLIAGTQTIQEIIAKT